MGNNKEVIEKKIYEIKEQLQNREDTDPAYLTEDIKDLRHWIMYAHLRVEQTLQIVLAHNISKTEFIGKNLLKILDDFNKLRPIFENMEFYSKIRAVQKLKLMPKKLIALFSEVNRYRVYFSHPAIFGDNIREYKDEKKQLMIYKNLIKVFELIDDFTIKNKMYISK